MLFFIITGYSFYELRVKESCRDWKKGIEYSLMNEKPYCKITEPLTCHYDIFKGMQDLSFFLIDTCHSKEKMHKLIKTHYNKNSSN
jgi:hypothetical protein